MMEVSIFCPHTQARVGIWVLADYGIIVDDSVKRAETLETVADAAIREYYNRRVRAGQSEREPDVRNS